MSNPILRVLTGAVDPRRIVESVVPRRSFEDVILPPPTRQALERALTHVTRHDLIFNRWGLRERHPTSLGLAFNFAGAPGTGKTICAEAIAHALGKRLLIVRYAEVESMWMGETPKNIVAAFRLARKPDGLIARCGGLDGARQRHHVVLRGDVDFVRLHDVVLRELALDFGSHAGVGLTACSGDDGKPDGGNKAGKCLH